MIRTQTLLTPELYELVKMQAEKEGLSLSALVRKALEKLMYKKKKTNTDILMDMAKDAVYDKSIPSDASTNDEYLYGKSAL
ncbi:hypothetical protein KC726_01570 [Candidatus Woesebacteria bacterium]|nr:hypothetical protein [Candidatus Woesebacteria bacterium]